MREALDARYGPVSRSEPEEAVAEIRAMRGTYRSPEELVVEEVWHLELSGRVGDLDGLACAR